jgi:predicted TIM-barrel fold metal-dependent hydrolase
MRRARGVARAAVLLTACVGGGLIALEQGTGALPGQERARQPPQASSPADACPPGETEVRPGRCRAPQLPPPTIVDYRPRSTLVVPERLVPRAKYPVIDIHNHTSVSAANIEKLAGEMDSLNVRVLNNLSGGSDPDAVKQKVAFIRSSRHPDRFRVFASVDWSGAGSPGWAERAVARLEQSVVNGAIGLKVFKNLGLSARGADGARLRVDDPALKPVWEACARLNVPVLIHVAEPQEFFSPLDTKNERWLELALFPERRHHGPGEPGWDELMEERDTMFAANPKTRFIAAHFGWYGSNLQRAGRLLEKLPNVFLDVSAVLYDFGRQPRAAREFFVKYQDRVLFGKDSYEPSEFPYYWRVFETADEYFDYYRPYHAFWKLYGLDLPDAVLKKVYYQNALRVVPGLPQAGWPK